MHLFYWVNRIRETQGNKAKMEALNAAVNDCSIFAEFLQRVYSGNYKYNLRSFHTDEVGKMPIDDCFDAYLSLLHRLNVRELTGNAAVKAVEVFAGALTRESQWLLQCTLNRSLDFGLNAKMINKVVPSLLPSNAYMRCSGYNGNVVKKWLDNKDMVLAQEKMDGMFVVINLNDRSIRTRSGKYFDPDLFQEVWDDLDHSGFLGGYCLHGEIITFDDSGNQNPREISNGILNSTLKVNTPLKNYAIFIWDCVEVETESGHVDDMPYCERFYGRVHRLKDDCKVLKRVKNCIVTSFEDIHDFYRTILQSGGEGLVIKNGNGVWENKTSKNQLKLKNEVDLDLMIVGYNVGRGKFKGQVGSVICETSDGLLSVDVSGMNDATRLYITENAEELLGTIMCVKANSIIEGQKGRASLFLPRFVELRTDKIEADTFERVKELFSKF